MSSSRKNLLRRSVVVNVGCGCRSPKLSGIHNPRPKSKECHYKKPDVYFTSSTAFSPNVESKNSNWKIGGSIAVVKDSTDPYLDFRQSMIQMILEKEIYAREDLRELLDCFISLNSPCHHDIIVCAFMEIWNGVFYGTKPAVRRKSRELKGIRGGKGT
ncbi:transcription repressor OFP6-like [Tasmannia lanceolata]|uniref:transcription repressor OFP6-like n=1 Tax=Tasmannia lanceolata TaxID=3420 RepID=UPI004062C3C5